MIQIMKHKAAKIFTILLVSLLASGCESIPFLDTTSDYKGAGRAKPLEVPPDLTSAQTSDAYTVPGSATSANSYNQNQEGQEVGVEKVLPDTNGVRMEKAGAQRWLVVNAPAEKIQAAVQEVGITFLFAPGWHPALKGVGSLRRSLGVRTVFNLLGPLVNPMRPTGQVIGVSDPILLGTIAQALQLLGTKRAIVLHGRERLDEAGLGDATDLALLSDGHVSLAVINPAELGLAKAPLSAIAGGDVQQNADILKAVLQGKGTQAQQDVVALNAALALQVGEAADSTNPYDEGIIRAQAILQSGAAWEKLEQLIKFLN